MRLEGDLVAMTKDWTKEETRSKRRLVEFERKQEDNILTVTFKEVTRATRKPNGICVSCIWWEDRNETYITSVDSIFLLESLVGSRFSVEEKNRIRRNMEGFKPKTICKEDKNKTQDEKDSVELCNDAFFNTIMGFEEPKPRNIEKDIKVFQWKILPEALKKILSKFVSRHPSPSLIHR